MNRIKEDLYNIKAECPTCQAKLDGSTGVSTEDNRAPKPGDMSICCHCGEPARFDKDMKLEKISNLEREQMVTSNPQIARAIVMIKARQADPDRSKEYTDQLDTMEADVKAWKRKNPDLDISIQYNYQAKMAVIGTLDDGIKNKFITVNDNAVLMFKELGWLDDGPKMPTIIMVRCVLEHAFKSNE